MRADELFLNRGDDAIAISLGFEDTDFIRELRVTLRYGRAEALRLDVRVKSDAALQAVAGTKPKSKFFSERLAASLRGKESIAITVPSFYGVIRDEPYVNDARLERLLGAGAQGSVVRNLVSDARRSGQAAAVSPGRAGGSSSPQAAGRHGRAPALQKRIRRDVADVVCYAPSPSTLTAPALLPPEVEELLKYLAA